MKCLIIFMVRSIRIDDDLYFDLVELQKNKRSTLDGILREAIFKGRSNSE